MIRFIFLLLLASGAFAQTEYQALGTVDSVLFAGNGDQPGAPPDYFASAPWSVGQFAGVIFLIDDAGAMTISSLALNGGGIVSSFDPGSMSASQSGCQVTSGACYSFALSGNQLQLTSSISESAGGISYFFEYIANISSAAVSATPMGTIAAPEMDAKGWPQALAFLIGCIAVLLSKDTKRGRRL